MALVSLTATHAAFSATTANGGNAIAMAAATGTGNYPNAVAVDSPTRYWQLDEPSGTTVVNSSGAPNAHSSNVTVGVPGINGGDSPTRGYSFNGTTSYISEPAVSSSIGTYSIDLWFKTAPGYTGGGPMIGLSSGADCMVTLLGVVIYMNTSGRVVVDVDLGGSLQTLTVSPAAYNDGAWHHVAMSYNGGASPKMNVYMDGNTTPVGTSNGTSLYGAPASWIIGCAGTTFGLTGIGSNHFAGTLDEIAVYNTVLSPARVHAHYLAGL